jgi:hypothetical protein
MRGNQLLAFSAVVDGGLRSNGELSFDLGVGIDDEMEFVGILVTVQR